MMIVKLTGNFLVVDETPVKSDVIIILSSGEGRLEKGVTLYKEGLPPICSYPMEVWTNCTKEHYSWNASCFDYNGDSVNQHVGKCMVFKRGYAKMPLSLCHRRHMRRVKVLFDQTFKHSDIRLIYSSGVHPSYNPNQWWQTKEDRYTTFTEYIKLVGNILGFHGDQAKKFLEKFYKV